MRVAVVTPYYKEPTEMLFEAHQSVLNQDYAATHVLIADGHPNVSVDSWDCDHIILPRAHRDAGSYARGVGAFHAISSKFDAVSFLDADCWFDKSHISNLVNVMQKHGVPVATSRRKLIRLDRSLLNIFDLESDGLRFADTSTLLISKDLIDIQSVWLQMPPELGVIGDRIVWAAIKSRGYGCATSGEATLNYQTRYQVHYLSQHESPPLSAISNEAADEAARIWRSLPEKTRKIILLGAG